MYARAVALDPGPTWQPRSEARGHTCAAYAMTGQAPNGSRLNQAPTHDKVSIGTVREILRTYPLIDELLDARRTVFGGQDAEGVFRGYRNHAYRILNLARQWTEPDPDRDEKIAICAVFHDIAAWPNGNLDYLGPSADQADAYLDQIGRAWKPEMRLMIDSHHKLTTYRGPCREWVEPVRRADWCDVSFSMLRFGLPKSLVQEIGEAFPLGPFYPAHVYKVTAKWMFRHPLKPIPILRW